MIARRVRGNAPRIGFSIAVQVFPRCPAKERELLAEVAAALAQRQVDVEDELFPERERPVLRLGEEL